MTKSPITVWYSIYHPDGPEETCKDVFAYCVGGEDGVVAYWLEGRNMHTAHGDDGNWWYATGSWPIRESPIGGYEDKISVEWVPEMIAAMQACLAELPEPA